MITLELTIAGIATGCIYALAAMGLVLTYKATGIFNFAYGAIAMLDAYVFWQTRVQWHWPLALAALFALGVAAPLIGLILELLVFRPLQRKRASAAEKLVATIGVLLLCLGAAFIIWTGKIRQAPRLITNRHISLPHHLVLGVDQLVTVILTIAIGAGLALMFKRTQLGVELRAVVDRRELAELASVNATRVAIVAWAMGCVLAGLTGILLVQGGPLDPTTLTLLVIETFSIAVVARLTSLPGAVAAGILILGVFQSYYKSFEPTVLPLLHWHFPGWVRRDLDVTKPILSSLVLFIALVIMRRLDEPSDEVADRVGIVGARRASRPALYVAALAAAVILPFTLDSISLPRGQTMLALIIIFASIVCITGFCGYITLGQAGFAGFGAYMTGQLVRITHMPVIPAMLLGGVGAMIVGIATGWPALKRRGLFLGLTTLAMGLLMYEAVFSLDTFRARGLRVPRPELFSGDRAFYFFELFWVVVLLVLANNLRKGRLGRILSAMRDSEVATQSIGIELRTYKLFIFAVSAFIAGIGGALIGEQQRIFTADQYHPLQSSLLWFMVVVVAGVSSIWGAIIGGGAFVLLDVVAHRSGVSQLVIAVLALFIGYLPGRSITGLLQWVWEALRHPRRLPSVFTDARRAPPPPPSSSSPTPSPSREPATAGLEPSDFARRVMSS